MCDNYESIEEYKRSTKHKILIVYDDMIPDMFSNKKTSYNNHKIIY